MKKQKIFYTPLLYPCHIGGVEIFNHYLIKNLNKNKNFELLVFTLCSKAILNNKNHFFINQRYLGLRRWGLGGISSFISILLNKKVKLKKLDCIYTSYTSGFSSDNIILLLLFKFLFNVPYIIHIHGGGMKPWNPKWLHDIFFKNAEKIAGVSERICEEYSKRSMRRVDFIAPLTPFKKSNTDIQKLKIKYKIQDFCRVILFVGSLKPLKAPNIVLEAFLKLNQQIVEKTNCALIFCGDGIMKNELELKSMESQFSSRIKFLGNIPNEYIHELYKITDLFVISSHFEGTPISLLQAMNEGLVCIGSNVNGINSLLTHDFNGLLFHKDDSFKLNYQIDRVLNDNVDVKKIKNNAKNFISKNYNYDNYINDLIKYISI